MIMIIIHGVFDIINPTLVWIRSQSMDDILIYIKHKKFPTYSKVIDPSKRTANICIIIFLAQGLILGKKIF